MDSDEGKVFIGGIAWDTTEDTLRDHFNQYGDVSQVVIMRDKTTGRPRGFGFVVFSDPSVLDRVLQDQHSIDGRTVEAKRALSREEQQTSSRPGNSNSGRGSGGGGNFKTKKIFVGGLPSSLTEEGFREYFQDYGHVTDVVIMFDQHTQRPRGFGFITFDAEDAVDRVLHKNFHELNGKLVEVKRALPKDSNPGGGGRSGSYQGYGSAGGNTSGVDSRMDGNRYLQTQTSAGAYPPYSGYVAPGYGYGAANSGVGFGGYGGYGVGGYGGGPTGAYGMPGALKNNWGSQVPSSYGANASYGVTAPWGASGGGNSSSGPVGQSTGGASAYGGYGYNNYGGSDGSYPGGYGAAGGRAGNAPNNGGSIGTGGGEQQGNEGSYGGGYGDANANTGYGDESWGTDPSQASSGYGGYGGAHSRQASQQ
ncbi:heterogeneous nuclear ribonucleoprotein 1-like [Mercurialis annua]|uniref:heterogeneous nuclear ribonucleoprotein 1-like n=1 Tax=Mercurialis annua TaxID=3986 RepID=UPI00215F2B3D|nr:heterogeneous nuclear ribonucleoprotein 1-like [Mercurialis annua]XP_055959559.1 heterogeneous nuclear ribonucleoprotein 1-like [Mercurialis annua]